jgi:UDP-N-acetylglucosamine 2-epimerase (non-hydrolysing)
LVNVCFVCGARPNFVKIAALLQAAARAPRIRATLVHTGQHYDDRMYRALFEDLGLPRPDVDLEVGSASHAAQTAAVMERFEPVAAGGGFDLVLVVGDVNSTVAAALVAAKLGIPVAHVEAGLRSFDRSMPEEINRLVTDALSDLLFVSEPSGVENLRREGVPETHVHFVGNVMIDTLLRLRVHADASDALPRHGLRPREYALLTLHRPAAVDDRATLAGLLEAVEDVQRRLPVIFPAHPRTRGKLGEFGLLGRAEAMPGLQMTEPLGYLDFLKLLAEARMVLTDSGGIQEETTILNVPCLTLRDNTERPSTVDAGLNRLVGLDPQRIRRAAEEALDRPARAAAPPAKWDGRAAQRIVDVLLHCDEHGVPRR